MTDTVAVPDYLLLIIDDTNLTQQRYNISSLFSYGKSLIDLCIPIKLAVVNTVGKVVFIDCTQSNINHINSTQSVTT